MKTLYIKVLFSIIIFTISVAFLAYPSFQKGYYLGADYQALLIAKNFAVSGTYNTESKNGILLSSDNAAIAGVNRGFSNQLTAILYGYIFQKFGVSDTLPHWIAIFLFAVFSVLMFWLLASLFSLEVGLVGALSLSFLPAVSAMANISGFYEFAIIFFGIAISIYFGTGRRLETFNLRVFIASIFFALAALARNAFAVSFLAFIIFDTYKHRSVKRAMAFSLPFLFIFGLTLTPFSYLGLPSGYTTKDNITFGQLGHLFNDPYSFYYDRENFIENVRNTGGFDRIGVSFAKRLGYEISFRENLLGYVDAALYYPMHLLDYINLGGPLIIGLILLGLRELWRKNKDVFRLFMIWFFVWYGSLTYLQFANWDHFVEIIFPLVALIALGAVYLYKLVTNEIGSPPYKYFIAGVMLIFLIGHLGYASKWRFHDSYRSSKMDETLSLAGKIEDLTLSPSDVVATGVHVNVNYGLAFLTDKNIVFFHGETLQGLVMNKKLKEAFNIYGVKVVADYPDELADQIIQETGAIDVSME